MTFQKMKTRIIISHLSFQKMKTVGILTFQKVKTASPLSFQKMKTGRPVSFQKVKTPPLNYQESYQLSFQKVKATTQYLWASTAILLAVR